MFCFIVPVFKLLTIFFLILTGKIRILKSGLLTAQQYKHAEEDLFCRIQLMRERESGSTVPIDIISTDSDSGCMDDPIIRSLSTERQQAMDEYGNFCDIVKKKRLGGELIRFPGYH